MLCMTVGPVRLRSQVNTETLRKADLEEGFYNELGFNYGLYAGNSEFQSIKLNFRSDLKKGKYSSFLVADLNKAYKDRSVFIDKGFIHLRGMRSLSGPFTAEAFLQKGYNDFIQLKSRDLAGSGMRIRMTAPQSQNLSVYTGIGLMWEREVITRPADEEALLRSTNYLSLKWNSRRGIGFTSTSYYQFHTGEFKNYRILFNGHFEVSLTQRIRVATDIDYRFDSRPPSGVKKYDLEIVNGIRIAL